MSSFDRNEEEDEEKDEGSPFPPRRSSLTGGGGDDDGDEDDERGNSEEAQFLTDLKENHTKKSNTTKVLSTYGGAGMGVKNHFLHVALSASVLVLGVFLCLGLVYIPAMNPMESYALKREDECFSRTNSTCENYLRAEVYFWNLTNPSEFVSGLEAPKLEEVGPFVIKDGVSKKQNVTFSEDGSEVGFVETLYGKVDWGTERAWEESEIISINPAYVEIIKSAGSEFNLALSALPQTLKGLHEAMVGFINACAYDPGLSSSFADLSAAVTSGVVTAEDLALGQLFSFSVSFGDGVPITTLPLPPAVFAPMYEAFGIDASSGPNDVFEVHGYVTGMQIAQGIPPPYAPYVANVSSAQALKYFFQNITEDVTGYTALRYLQTPDSALTAELGFTDDAQSQIMKGYLGYIAQTFGLPALLKFTIGDFLNSTASGLLVKRSAKEWIFGFDDPLLNAVSSGSNGQDNKVRAVHNIRDIDTLDVDHVPWGTDAQTMLRAGATPYRLKTGLGVSKGNATTFLRRTDGDWSDRIVYPTTNHIEIVSGKQITGGQYEEIKEHFKNAKKGEESMFAPAVQAWADFGQGLDLRRKVTLQHREGETRKKNKKVSTEVYSFASKTYLNCPITGDITCDWNQNFYGAFNFSGFLQGASGFYSLAHGYQTDFRAFGGSKDSYPYTSFSPNATNHSPEFEIYARTGNTVGMKVPLQQNFKIEPTDTFYQSVWQPPASSVESTAGLHLPICHLQLSYAMPESFFNKIADTINHVTMMTVVYLYVMPAISVCFIAYAALTLYVRHQLARTPTLSESDYKKRATSSASKAIGSFHDASFILGGKKSFKTKTNGDEKRGRGGGFFRNRNAAAARTTDDNTAAPMEEVVVVVNGSD